MIVMYDDINLSLIPKDAEAVAGYVNGRWPTYPAVVKLFPKAHHLSIAVSSYADAECLDVEPGDATNAVAPGWVRKQQARGVKRPVVYTSVSNAQSLLNTLARVGIKRADVRLWTAHYTGHAHICGPQCGFGLRQSADATQWTDRALGRSLDQSLCVKGFFAAIPAPPPPSPPGPHGDGGPFVYHRNRDGTEHWEAHTKRNIAYRTSQYLRGKFLELRFVRKAKGNTL